MRNKLLNKSIFVTELTEKLITYYDPLKDEHFVTLVDYNKPVLLAEVLACMDFEVNGSDKLSGNNIYTSDMHEFCNTVFAAMIDILLKRACIHRPSQEDIDKLSDENSRLVRENARLERALEVERMIKRERTPFTNPWTNPFPNTPMYPIQPTHPIWYGTDTGTPPITNLTTTISKLEGGFKTPLDFFQKDV